MSKQTVRDRDVIEARWGASAFRELALLGVFCVVIGVTAWVPGASAGASSVKGQQDQSGAGVMLSKQATAKEVGLPVYPGAKAHKDEKDDSGNVQMGIWGGSFGFGVLQESTGEIRARFELLGAIAEGKWQGQKRIVEQAGVRR